MADENQNVNAEDNVSAQPEATSTEPVVEEQIENTDNKIVEEEKLLKQSEVNKIVGGAKVDAYERGKREAMLEMRQKEPSAPETSQEKIVISKDELQRVVEETAAAQASKAHAERVVGQFVNKMQLGMQKYNDFENVVGKLDIPNLPPQVIDWANAMDNTADVMYELAKSPQKFANVMTLTVTSPRLAYDEFVRLSDSLKKNEEAVQNSNQNKVAEPLDQVKPSISGTDSGKLETVSDYRKQPWLRG